MMTVRQLCANAGLPRQSAFPNSRRSALGQPKPGPLAYFSRSGACLPRFVEAARAQRSFRHTVKIPGMVRMMGAAWHG